MTSKTQFYIILACCLVLFFAVQDFLHRRHIQISELETLKNVTAKTQKSLIQTVKAATTDSPQYVNDSREIFSNHSWPVANGQHFTDPVDPTGRVAVIIPYRNRQFQLIEFLKKMTPIFLDQNLNYKLYVINQTDSHKFNRGALLNVGVREAVADNLNFTCFIFHDVDRYLADSSLLSYQCDRNHAVMHMTPKSGPRHLNSGKLGGVVKINTPAFIKSHGYSNYFYGWGGEDDDFAWRVRHIWAKIYCPSVGQKMNTWINYHEVSKRNETREERWKRMKLERKHPELKVKYTAPEYCDERVLLLNHKFQRFEANDGFNSTQYSAKRSDFQLFTLIDVKLVKMEFLLDDYQKKLKASKIG